MYSKDQILSTINKCLEEKGTRKFTQTVELALNFRETDFSKPENRLNLEVVLPKGRGKTVNIVVFADGALAADAKTAGADVIISGAEIPNLEKKKLKNMADNSEFFAQPQLMMQIGKSFGQVLGGRGKLPKPIVGNVGQILKNVRNTVKLRTKGKNLPTVHCPVGTEKMSAEDIYENISAVLNAVTNKLGEQRFASAYLKLSMGKSIKIGA
jgi:large subunit ribosomal protein L1